MFTMEIEAILTLDLFSEINGEEVFSSLKKNLLINFPLRRDDMIQFRSKTDISQETEDVFFENGVFSIRSVTLHVDERILYLTSTKYYDNSVQMIQAKEQLVRLFDFYE